MNLATFQAVVEVTIDKCLSVLTAKGTEYTRDGDRLSNFKQAGMLDGETSVKALGGMMKKHTVSIYDYIKDYETGVYHPLEEWDEKIIDHINYLILLRALIMDMAEGEVDFTPDPRDQCDN